MAIGIVGLGAQLETKQHLLLVGQVADYTPQRKRQRLDQRGRREDSLVLCKCGMLLYIDDLELVGAGKLFVAYAAKVRDRGGRARACACYEEPKQVLGQKSSEGVRETLKGPTGPRRLSSPARRKGCIT